MGFLKRCRIQDLLIGLFLIPSSFCNAQNEDGIEYERSSIHVMMIKHLNQRFDDLIENVFLKTPFPQRFNNHDLGVKVVSFAELKEDQSHNIASFIKQVNLGQKMVAKWFNRNKQTGSFDMNLIKERGFYNATQHKINEARASIRGLALLEDAGENLISNTYLVVNDINYISKGSRNWFLKFVAGDMEHAMHAIGGFKVNIVTYLFRLEWNDDIANTFYTNYYTEDGAMDTAKTSSFKTEKELFQMVYLGKAQSESSERHFTSSKEPEALLVEVTTRAMDQNLAILQHLHADFRIKTPLISTSPLKADVGLKEDVNENSRFEVLERVLNEKGQISYQRVGIIKPIKEKIKDNRYGANEEDVSDRDATEFEAISGRNFVAGMLIRELHD
ncbi:MAG: hypothetical protein LBM06_03695 [Prevotellaceae bacterium]|jgi:hypothetical protein|nr:hypothetical protein [Prevotellaceae bacterium]